MKNALYNASRLGVLINSDLNNEEAPMSTRSFPNLSKRPVAVAIALAAMSYFGSISTALAGKPGPDFFVCILLGWWGRGGMPPFC